MSSILLDGLRDASQWSGLSDVKENTLIEWQLQYYSYLKWFKTRTEVQFYSLNSVLNPVGVFFLKERERKLPFYISLKSTKRGKKKSQLLWTFLFSTGKISLFIQETAARTMAKPFSPLSLESLMTLKTVVTVVTCDDKYCHTQGYMAVIPCCDN